MYRTYSTQFAGRELSVEIGRVAELANGAAIVRYGETVVLVTAGQLDHFFQKIIEMMWL